jgi:hypothetical protein
MRNLFKFSFLLVAFICLASCAKDNELSEDKTIYRGESPRKDLNCIEFFFNSKGLGDYRKWIKRQLPQDSTKLNHKELQKNFTLGVELSSACRNIEIEDLIKEF